MKITKELQKIMDKYDWKLIDEINWNWTCRCQILSEKFIEKYFDKLDLNLICIYQELSESFIEKYFDELNKLYINHICQHQVLSEKFIEKYFYELNLYHICQYQKLSEKFIEKHIDEISEDNLKSICICQDMSENFIKKYKLDLGLYNKVHRKISYRKKVREVKEYCKEYNLKFDEENKCFYAYREHDQRGNGMFSNSIFYEKGKYYKDWHLDMRKDKENSFGLGIYPKGNTKVKVLIKDWGVKVNRNDGKCRVWGFEIV